MYLKRLKDLREDNDYTQTYIAKILNMKQQQYSRYETGEFEIPLECLIVLAKLYNVSTDYILNLTDIKNQKEK